MELRRTVSLGFRFMSGFALLFMLVALGLAGWNLHFALTAEVRPGVFIDYYTARVSSRVRDSRGHYRDTTTEEHRPSFRYTTAEGVELTVEEGEPHLFRAHDPGESIEVLVDPDGAREPMVKGFVSLFGDALGMLLVGAVFVGFAELARSKVLGFLGDDRGRLSGIAARLQATHAARGASNGASAAVGEASAPRRSGCGALLLYMGVLAAAGAGAFVWLIGLDEERAPVSAARTEVEPAAPIGADLPPPVVAPEEPATADPAPAGRPERREPSPLQQAASAGDAQRLRDLLAAGGDVAEVRPATVKTLVAKRDVRTLRVLFENGFDLSQHYARQTFGDQAVSGRLAEVVRLVREFDGLFEAPPEFVALAAEDVEALRAALAEAPAEGNRWRGQTIDSFARHPAAKALLERARAP